MELLHLTPAVLRQAAVLKERITELESELESVLGASVAATPGRKLHWSQTPAGRVKLARNARKRWRGQRGSSKATPKTSARNSGKVHWTQTPAGRAKMARLMQRRWNSRKKAA